MKHLKNIGLALLITLSFASCKQENKEVAKEEIKKEAVTEADLAKMQTASFTIDGMTCAMGCAKTIENKLAEQASIYDLMLGNIHTAQGYQILSGIKSDIKILWSRRRCLWYLFIILYFYNNLYFGIAK